MSRSPWDEAKARRQAERPVEKADTGARPTQAPRGRPPERAEQGVRAQDERRGPREKREPELRLYGWNACMAAFRRRPQDLRKVYLHARRMPEMGEVLAYCVEQRLGYRLVEEEDLNRLSGSQHHEGLCFDMRWPTPPSLTRLLSQASDACLLVWLDGVGNPHNLGAILRSAAHFGVSAVLSPARAGVRLSGAAARVAEGGAEAVPLLSVDDVDGAWRLLRAERFTRIATLPVSGNSVFRSDIPARSLFVLGAEQTGMNPSTLEHCDLQIAIPGSGEVESLNVASAAAVMFAEWARRWA